MLRKNTASQFVHIAGVNVSTGAIVTGATWTMRRCLDGTFAAGGATITEDTGTGFYKVALTQADTNGNDIGYFFTATNCVPVTLNVIATAADPTDSVRFGLSALPNVAAGGTNGLIINGSNTGAITLGATTFASVTSTGAFTLSDGLLISRTTGNSSAITATGSGTGHGAVFTSGNGATGDGVQMTSGAANGNGLKLTKTGSGNDFSASVTNISLAKTTNITGFNDIAATSIVSSGAITTSGGAVSTVTTVTNQLTTAQIATAVWTDTTAGDFTVALSIGKSVMNGVSLGTGLTIAAVSGAVGSVTAGVTVTTNNDKTGYALTSGERTSIADTLLDRDMSVGTDSGSTTVRTPRQALRFVRNKWVVSGTALTVYKEDDSTSSWTATVTATPGADPITGNDPA
jgi:hypothetical protein